MRQYLRPITLCAFMALALFGACTFLPPSRREWGVLATQQKSINVTTGDKVYLVKVNTSLEAVPAPYAGAMQPPQLANIVPLAMPIAPQSAAHFARSRTSSAPLTHYADAVAFNALSLLEMPPQSSPRASMMMRSAVFAEPAPGATRTFWVQNSAWVQITAQLITNGSKCRIWVASSNYDNNSGSNTDNKIKDEQAQYLADYFDSIYPLETEFFGYEYGGGPDGNGGIDGDPKIHILVYDIGADATVGYFWGKDEYTQEQLSTTPSLKSLKSNQAEIFYIDSYFLDNYEELAYATLVHEFQHMIHYNQKTLKGMASQTWYNEMLSMLAEDMLVTGDGHPAQTRITDFNQFYNGTSVTQWLSGAALSYAQTYAFGAYLARNYGGAALVHEMAHNGMANVHSVDGALQKFTGGSVGFFEALKKFPEAVLNKSPQSTWTGGVWDDGCFATLNNAVPGAGNVTGYDFAAIDIYDPSYGGVLVQNLRPPQEMPPASFEIHELNIDTRGITTAQLQINVSYYTKSTVSLFLIRQDDSGEILEKVLLN